MSAFSMQGRRKYQEDRVSAYELSPGYHFLIVCDGHGGDGASEYFMREVLKGVRHDMTGLDIVALIRKAEGVWDQRFLRGCQPPRTERVRNAMFDRLPPADTSGTTLAAALIGPDRMHVVNVGDSRVAWIGEDGIVYDTHDHKPRAEDLGPIPGNVVSVRGVDRVNGVLAVGRALGDNVRELMGTLSSTPDVYEVVPAPAWVGVATDGVWDVMKTVDSYGHSAESLCLYADQLGSTDNISAAVYKR